MSGFDLASFFNAIDYLFKMLLFHNNNSLVKMEVSINIIMTLYALGVHY
jgi:hypothetical protein